MTTTNSINEVWCWACKRNIPTTQLTPGGRHDEDQGGCGCYIVENDKPNKNHILTKDERNQLLALGYIILRPQHNNNRWSISKLTRRGGWARFGGNWYLTHDEAMATIDMLIKKFPTQYKKES